jgi:hypothetical protein
MKLNNLRIVKDLDFRHEKDFKNKEITNRIRWIDHKETPILLLDYSNFLNSDEIITTISEVNQYIKKLGAYDIILLVDVRDSQANEKMVVDALKQNALILKPYVKKAAIIGVTPKQEVILTVVNMFSNLGLKPFNSIDGAKDWLIS